MFVSNALTPRHQQSKTCATGQARKLRRLQQLENESREAATLYINGTAIENVDSFRYLGRILTANGEDQLAVSYNLCKARKSWRRIQPILCHQGATPRTSGNFYKEVVQAVLLYGSETWNITKQQLDLINGFHNRVTRMLSNNPIRQVDDKWIYPNLGYAQRITGIDPIGTYVTSRKTTLLQWAQNRPIYNLARHLESTTNMSFWGPNPSTNNTMESLLEQPEPAMGIAAPPTNLTPPPRTDSPTITN
jgi:hypothetical protein